MRTELIGGILIGLMINDWSGRFILPAAVGLFACGELFFLRRRRPLRARWKQRMRSEGVSEQEIAQTEQAFKEMSEAPFRETGLTGWRLYTWQFVWSTVTTLPIVIVSGLVHDWLT
jgi:hypothetical protein